MAHANAISKHTSGYRTTQQFQLTNITFNSFSTIQVNQFAMVAINHYHRMRSLLFFFQCLSCEKRGKEKAVRNGKKLFSSTHFNVCHQYLLAIEIIRPFFSFYYTDCVRLHVIAKLLLANWLTVFAHTHMRSRIRFEQKEVCTDSKLWCLLLSTVDIRRLLFIALTQRLSILSAFNLHPITIFVRVPIQLAPVNTEGAHLLVRFLLRLRLFLSIFFWKQFYHHFNVCLLISNDDKIAVTKP